MSLTASTSVAARIEASGELFFFKKQLFFVFTSSLIAIFMSFFNEKFASFTIILYFLISLALLILVPIIGFDIKGSKRWVYLLSFSLQPAEFIKTSYILINAYFLKIFDERKIKIKKLVVLDIFLAIVVLYLLYKQPDIGSCMLIFITAAAQILFLKNFKQKAFFLLLTIFLLSSVFFYFSFPHIYSRINSYIASFSNIDKAQYQVKMSVMGYKNAGLLGKGFMEGEVKKYIPDAHTDFIFPVIAEEFGFFIILLILLTYFYLFCRIIIKARYTENNFIFFALTGLASLFIFQMLINVGVSLNLLPTKGMTLPFLSYGGSSLISNGITFGYILVYTRSNIYFNKNDNILQ